MKLQIRGTSHSAAIHFLLEGIPAGFQIDEAELARFMARRAPGRDALSTARCEPDRVELTRSSDRIEGVIRNTDVRPRDYGEDRTVPRPGHADFGQWVELGQIPTGGGKNSGRLTVALCAAGGICKQWLERRGITVAAEIASIGKVTNPKAFDSEILKVKKSLDSIGGTIRCRVTGMRPGLGGPLFDGLDGALSQAVFAIPGVKGIEFGNGFAAAELCGSQNNDAFVIENGVVKTATNRHGGILGGRTTGMPIEFTVAMKPTPTIYQEQQSVDLETMRSAKLAMKGRHDPCIVRRAVPVVEAMAAYVLADKLLSRTNICLTLTGKTIDEDYGQYRSQLYWTDMVEVRVDLLQAKERGLVHELLQRIDVPAIVTLRRERDGGEFDDGGDGRRKTWFQRFLKGLDKLHRPVYLDLETDFDPLGLASLAESKGVGIVRSLHDFKGKPKNDLVISLIEMRKRKGEIPKIAFKPRNLADVIRAFNELYGPAGECVGSPWVVCAMGPLGFATRALAQYLGMSWTYASVDGLEGLGHVSPRELVSVYRFREQTPEFKLYGVTGFPLKATRSPEINNRAWSEADEDKVMIPFPARTAKEAKLFFEAMSLRGMAVTIPHKQSILPLLDRISQEAEAIGAVNTVGRCRDGLVGANTDAIGFAEAIRRFVGRDDLAGLAVAVLGAGGASKAVVYALKKLHAQVTVFHRTTPPPIFELIVNATPVDPIPDYAFTGRELVYDLVYVPEVTPLIARAQAAGCKTENGFSMLVAQAAAQRRIWS